MNRKVNDVGGLAGALIDQAEHDPTFYEKRIDAMLILLTSPKVHAFSVDALRRAIEENTADDYTKRGYYEKWLKAIRQLLVEQGILSDSEINERIDAIKKGRDNAMIDHYADASKPSFKVGDRVVVKSGPPEEHCRTPTYLRGTFGEVVELVGHYHNPSLLAFHKPGLPKVWLYRVRFQLSNIWDQYKGSERDSVMADLYEHWLTPTKEH